MERSKHGNRSDTNTDYLFQLLRFLKLYNFSFLPRNDALPFSIGSNRFGPLLSPLSQIRDANDVGIKVEALCDLANERAHGQNLLL
ncbi:hypothetical protein Pint_22539 [Pistacia integerrima]|uniref:Uncharacterized protein n=1 Tax=Pistacia integerrima TaxID=434235 RepID=A0ACC0YLG8_9ROSI|nr:hypothetical protein Pint_22539 [Pistacia integerrima]